MLHWKRTSWAGRGVCLGILAALSASGCGSRPPAQGDAQAPGKPAETKPQERFPVTGEVQQLDLTLTDKDGRIVARVKAGAGVVGQAGASGGAAGALQRTEATLHEQGKPVATLTAERIDADQETRTLTGTGGVVARSLIHPDSPTVRADTMTWRHGENKIHGKGNVLITRGDSLRLPGTSFVADIGLQEVEVRGDGSPITGRL